MVVLPGIMGDDRIPDLLTRGDGAVRTRGRDHVAGLYAGGDAAARTRGGGHVAGPYACGDAAVRIRGSGHIASPYTDGRAVVILAGDRGSIVGLTALQLLQCRGLLNALSETRLGSAARKARR